MTSQFLPTDFELDQILQAYKHNLTDTQVKKMAQEILEYHKLIDLLKSILGVKQIEDHLDTHSDDE